MTAKETHDRPVDHDPARPIPNYVTIDGAPSARLEPGSRRLTGSEPRFVLARAREALAEHRWGESAKAFAHLLSSPGYEAEARYGLGWIELHEGSADRAEVLFREAIDYDPQHANAWFALGHLAETRSAEEAIADYRKTLAANPEHFGAAERLRQLGQAPSMFIAAAPPPAAGRTLASGSASAPGQMPPRAGESGPSMAAGASTKDPPGDLSDPGTLGVVEFLRRDNNPISQQALARITSLERSNGFRSTAHLQDLIVRFVVVVGLAAVMAKIAYAITPVTVGGHAIHFYSRNVTQVIVAAFAVWAGWALWTLLDCATNTVTITNGRIRWTRGVLNKHTETLDVWTARDIELERNLLQRLTRDGTLTFKGTLHDRPRRLHKGQFKPLRLTGIGHGAELDQIYALLLDLKFLLRAHQGVKGIIQ
jgi:tetratricopeptide (TPR) repeat protein